MSSFKTGAALGVKPIVLPEGGAAIVSVIDINWDDVAAIAANDIVELCTLPAGVKIVDVLLQTQDIDTGTTAAATFGALNAAGTDIATAIATGITAFQAGGVYRLAVAHVETSAAERKIGLKFTGGQAGALTGKKAIVALTLRA